MMKDWLCCLLICHQQKRSFGGWRTNRETSLILSEDCKTLETKTQHGGDCDATIAKAAAAVTHVQSQSQKVGSGDEGLGSLCFNLSSAETDFRWLEDEQRGFA